MIKCDLSKLSFVWNFYNKIVVEFSLILFGAAKQDCVIKTREMFSFLSLINNPVTIELSFALISISGIISLYTINVFSFSSVFCSLIFL